MSVRVSRNGLADDSNEDLAYWKVSCFRRASY
jgi:hypothetical protein